jgi:hypothetical protein
MASTQMSLPTHPYLKSVIFSDPSRAREALQTSSGLHTPYRV